MQPELPWNVAGIPPEAREAARAAARREGLSVGEWLTRRILRGFAAAADEGERAMWGGLTEPMQPPPSIPPRASRDTEEMLAHVSRSESETQNAYKAIDQQLKSVARRLETTERDQTENNRAMTHAATQINIAAREQAQAFEQMSANVTALAERLARVERHAANEGAREAMKALHQGLSRVADQIAQTANQSASQIAALAGNVDSLAANVDSLAGKVMEADATAQALETQLGALDERIRVVERTAYASASAIDHTMENVEQLTAAKSAAESETRRQAAAVAQMKDVFDHLNARISATEANAGAVARIEETVARLQQQDANNPSERRLQGIEKMLSDIVMRIEHTERAGAGPTGSMEQTLRDVAAGFDAADKRNREAIHELQATVQEAAARIAAMESRLAAPPAEQAARQHPIFDEQSAPQQPIFDEPPFPEHAPPMNEPAADFAPTPAFSPFAEHTDDLSAGTFGAPFTDAGAQHGNAATESFLAAARRSAKAAAKEAETVVPPRASMGGFNWTFSGKGDTAQPKQSGKRYALAGSIFGVAIAAALAGVVLSRGVGLPQPSAATPTISSPFAARPSLAPPRPSSDDAAETPQPQAAANDATAAPAAAPSVAPAPHVRSTRTHQGAAGQTAAAPKQTPAAAAAADAAMPSSPMQKLASLANSGDSKSQLLLGLKYLDGNGVAANEAEAARWLARAAQQGEPLAQYRLGTLYERGRGVAADPKQATHWYELAAKQGNRKAMHNLAVAYAEGSGEAKDNAQAALWFSRAANLGLADSEFNLAVLYERGLGVKQSLVDAYKWYLVAAAQGDAESKTRADALSTQLSDTDRTAAQAAAAAFRPQPLNPSANTAPVLG